MKLGEQQSHPPSANNLQKQLPSRWGIHISLETSGCTTSSIWWTNLELCVHRITPETLPGYEMI